MHNILFTFSGSEHLADSLLKYTSVEEGNFTIRKFPDGESYVRLLSNVKGKSVYILCNLAGPDDKFLTLYFLCRLLKEQETNRVTLITPYLPYMRQDKQFSLGEAVTNKMFAELLSSFIDELITIDPHLHRIKSLNEIYSVPCKALSSANLIASYTKNKIEHPVFVGPDEESRQWVSEVSNLAKAPFIVLHKTRMGDKSVSITVPELEKYKNNTVVLVDDIISTAHTMIETVKHLHKQNSKRIVCIGVHAVFAGTAYEDLKNTGVTDIVTTNSIRHQSNRIDISGLLSGVIA